MPESIEAPFRPDFSEGVEIGLYLALLELIDEGLLIVSDEALLEVNAAACRWLERSYRELVHQPLEILFPSPEAFLHARARWFIQGQTRGSISLALPGARTREFRFTAAARLRPGMHAILFAPDVVRELYRDATHPEAFWARIAAANHEPTIVLDERERIIAANATARALFPGTESPLMLPLARYALVQWPEDGSTGHAQIEGLTPKPLTARVLSGPRPGWRVLLLPLQSITDRPHRRSIKSEPTSPLAAQLAQSPSDAFVLLIAPIIDVGNGTIAGAEALVHWTAQGNENLPWERVAPLLADPAANRAWLEMSLTLAGQWVQRWRRPVALNLALTQMKHVDTLPLLQQHWHALGLPWHWLQLEVEEAVFAQLSISQCAELLRLADAGVGLVVDDIGERSFSLGMLARLPLRGMKLSPAWVQGVGRDERAERLIDGLAHLAKALEIPLMARGVTTCEQRDFLAALGCRLQQGPLFGPTVPADQPLELRASRSDVSASR